ASFRVLAALSLAALGCRGADAAKRESTSSSSSSPSATPATAAAARSPSAALTDSVSAHADSGRIRGNQSQNALWIVETSDFQCPYCKMWHDSTFNPLVRDFVDPGKVVLAYLNFPLRQHQNSMPAAEAAMCASVQNKFWPMHDALFTSQEKWETLPDPMPMFDSTVAHLGVAMPAWRDCVTRHLTRPLIEADYARSQSAGVRSTPTFFVGDQRVDGFAPYTAFRRVVEGQLAKRGASH
ncbi:MAG TPA: thioredoxin domain-containing protein, partial [Gemmatimonadaceae bacterium]|nr:thioredoxin domain-containing protein [Gemmatimonadaceae bacterium]